MPPKSQEPEQKKSDEAEEQNQQAETEPKTGDAAEQAPEPVETGAPSDADQENLLDNPVPEGSTGPTAPEPEQELPPAPAENEAPQSGTPDQGQQAGQEAQTGTETTTPSAESSPPSAGTASQAGAAPAAAAPAAAAAPPAAAPAPAAPAAAAPAAAPPVEEYALLKKDVSSLVGEEVGKRKELLQKKYVEDWKQQKSKQMEELSEDLADDEKSKEETRQSVALPRRSRIEKHLKRADTAKEVIDIGADVADFGFSRGTDIADAVYKKRDPGGNDKATKDKSETTGKVGNWAGIATGGWGMASGLYGAGRSGYQARQKSKKGDARGARLSRFDTASNLFGAGSGALGASSGIAGLKGADDASDWLGAASGMLDTAGALTNFTKGAYQKRSYGKLARRRETVDSKAEMSNKHIAAKEKYRKMKADYAKGDKDARSKEKRMEMLRQRHEHKRSKDFTEAMLSAQENASRKSKGGNWGMASGGLGTLSSLIGLAGSFAKQFGGVGGAIAGAVLGGISGLMKLGTTVGDKIAEGKEEKAGEKSRAKQGEQYLKDKVASLLKKPEAQADHVSEAEARDIVAQRLGLEDASKPEEVYRKLAERRADRILNKEEGYKEVLAAMGLSENADKATILEALGVS